MKRFQGNAEQQAPRKGMGQESRDPNDKDWWLFHSWAFRAKDQLLPVFVPLVGVNSQGENLIGLAPIVLYKSDREGVQQKGNLNDSAQNKTQCSNSLIRQ